MITESKNKRSTAIDSPEASNLGTEYGEYYCTTGWHLSRVSKRGSAFAGYVYELAYMLTNPPEGKPEPKEGRVFYASLDKIAEHFGVDRKTIYRAVEILTEIGLFELIVEGGYMEPSAYRVWTHKQWAKTHPGKCIERIEFSFSAGDELGRRLHQASAGRLKYRPYELKALRNTGLRDDELVDRLRIFLQSLNRDSRKRLKWKQVGFDFLQSVKETNPPQQRLEQQYTG